MSSLTPSTVYAALKKHPLANSALPHGFKLRRVSSLPPPRGYVTSSLAGPDASDLITFLIAPSVNEARDLFNGMTVYRANARLAGGGLPSTAVLVDTRSTGADARSACGRPVRRCVTTEALVRSGFVIVRCAASVANGLTGAASATTLARAALKYLAVTERRIRATK
jgi:hypothetical protein